MKMNKRMMSLALMATLISSGVLSTATAFAAEGDPSVTIKGSVTLPTVSLELPTSEQSMVLDVYNESGLGQVQGAEFDIKNNGKLGVDISLKNYTVGIEGTNKLTLATAPVTASSTKKELFLFLDESKLATADKDNPTAEEFAYTYDSKADVKKVVKAGTADIGHSYGTIEGTGLDASGGAGVKTFRMYGNLNEKAAWASDDAVSVTPIFKATPVKHNGE